MWAKDSIAVSKKRGTKGEAWEKEQFMKFGKVIQTTLRAKK